ncbi:glucosaminidase domain-containing protein [Candidatus Enterococcus ferrettii]|uniref:Mannosyl-glycoprotein endo-beta-N-acetylglucosamidase-like domain-containing protein n=1 Tax=Candidatus Enterococcus ferrettii TaxID=2815324 RepID=A0ABV0EMZ3_9ENTE|nr:glucosaminidase domain-containing protein [Enterococcus sp. 665A]MBO1339795.1 glucosaminidase domain-containing protein [Enterococcus sp. 665A]
MKGRLLLGCFVLSSCLLIAWQTTLKQTVLAESEEIVSSQPETTHGIVSHSTVVSTVSTGNQEVMETTSSSSVSSIEETKSTEDKESSAPITETIESGIRHELPSNSVSEEVGQIQIPLPVEKVVENYHFSVSKNQTTEGFIQTIGKDAQQIAWSEDLYASVMIAQAILETGSGNSQLARPPYHNLFGIKGSYQGKQVTFKTQEDKGNGELYTIQAAFRQYPSYKESLEDYAALLRNGLSGNSKLYQGTWKETAAAYQEATKALTGTYATDTAYDRKLNALIETYGLTVFDQAAEEVNPTAADGSGETVSQIKQESSTTGSDKPVEESKLIVTRTKYKVIKLQPIIQRQAKQVSGKQIVE